MRRSLPRREKALLAVALASYLALAWATLHDYGLGWDAFELYLGDRNFFYSVTLNPRYLEYYRPMLQGYYARPDAPDMYHLFQHHVNVSYQVWPFGATLAGASKYLLYGLLDCVNAIDAAHAAIPLEAVLLALAMYLFLRRYSGRGGAVVAVAVLLTYPRFFAHLHNNFKDVPAAALLACTMLACYHGVMQRRARWLVVGAICWGASLATKGNGLFLPAILWAWFAVVAWQRRRRGEPVLTPRCWTAVGLFGLIALAVMALCWPFLFYQFPMVLVAHINWLRWWALLGPSGWHADSLVYFLVTMPLAVMALATIAGMASLRQLAWRRRVEPLPLMLLLWIALPLVRVSMPHASDFNGIRHWLEVVPAVALAAGLGAHQLLVWLRWLARRRHPRLLQRARRCWLPLLLVATLAPVVAWDIRNHPYQILYFNPLIGRLPGARQAGLRDADDYWVNSYRRGLRWLNAHAPPNTLLLVPVGSHVVQVEQPTLLRHDIQLGRYDKLSIAQLIAEIDAWPGPVMLMSTVLCPAAATDAFCTGVRERYAPLYQPTVDGAPVMSIFQLK